MFRHQTGGSINIYDQGGGSRASVSGGERPEDIAFALRSTDISLARTKSMKQPKIKGGLLKTLRKKLGEAVSKFIIYERLPMNLSNSPWLHNLIVAAAEVGKNVKCPTPYEVSDVYLEAEYNTMQEWIKTLKGTWKDKATRDTDFYFQLLDKIVEEVGEEHVVQVVTDNEAALKAVGHKLMDKRPHLYWFACAAHCLDLCLEDIGKKKNVQAVLNDAKTVTNFIYNHIWTVSLMKQFTNGREIVRPGITRFATQCLQLQAILKQKDGLIKMFDSQAFKRSKFGRDKSGVAFEAHKIVNDKEFWSKSVDILKIFEPLVKVLRLCDGDEKPTMGFLYEAIDRAKQSIQKDVRCFQRYHEYIDERWSYFLNPQFQYGLQHWRDVYKETFDGTKKVIMRLERNMEDQIQALNQLMIFKDKGETFDTPQAQMGWSKMNPAERWEVFGECAPQLTRLARGVHRSVMLKMRHQKRRSSEEIEKSFNPINLDYIFQEDDPLSPWIEERENPVLDGTQDSQWLPIDSSDDELVEDGGGDTNSNGSRGALSPPSNNSGGGGNEVGNQGSEQGDEEDDQRMNDPYQEMPHTRRDQNLVTDMTGLRLGRYSQSKRERSTQNIPLEESSSHVAQSFSDFSIDEYNTHNEYSSDGDPSLNHSPINYDPYYQQ
ncbi:uncharacterized protein LOC130743915 [Lotus japonicus]|uniref:uncharacterized protein LOC130743915 n=1 Tax=Lotus japonicus TaxID=34305 RepID=UPI00258C6A2D|nr:uncharacterized protein LOC130743915 [Lotus japonicus]